MNIYLVRHGETDWNKKLLFQGQTDTRLNKAGKAQARFIAEELKDKKIDLIISSDLARARQTAEIIKKAVKSKRGIILSKDLRERHYGNLEGKKYNRLFSQRHGFTGEKDPEFFRRINRFFRKMIRKNKGSNIVITTHGGVVRQIVSFVLGLKNYKRLRIYNASLSEIYYDPAKDTFFLLLLNSVAHLPKRERNKIEYHIKGV